jgi:ABC-type sugar transport system substrate-binding protein
MPRVQLLPGNYIMQQFLQALAAASARRSHSVVVVVPDGDPREEMRRLIASRTVDAFLLSELQRRGWPAAPAADQRHRPGRGHRPAPRSSA